MYFSDQNEPSDWNITLSSNVSSISHKRENGTQCHVTLVESLENISLKPELQPVNIHLSAYNVSKIPVVRKCSLTIAQKSNSFKVSFIAIG